jgi:hypothetical protein
MVKKLFRHELNHYFRSFWLFLPIVLAVGVMTRIFRFLDNGSFLTEIAIFSSSAMLFVSCSALMILSTAVAIIRFYKNMYSAEGYLTFTLPVTNTQHIFVKMISAMLFQSVCLVTVILSVLIAGSGGALLELFQIFGGAIGELASLVGTPNLIAYALEFLLVVLLAAASNLLLFYACITIGQLAKKNRILLAIGAYFIYYVASQILSTIFTIIFVVLSTTSALNGILEFVLCFPVLSIHLYLVGMLLFSGALAAVFWLVTQRIMTKKLNLE